MKRPVVLSIARILTPTRGRIALIVVFAGPAAIARDVPVPTSSAFATEWDKTHFSHSLFSQVLSAHVDDAGLVSYRRIGNDERFNEYLYRLAHTDPAGLASSDARLAYWLNAYNAFAIQGVLSTLPVDDSSWANYSVLRVTVPGAKEPGKGFFAGLKFLAGSKRYSLDEIEKAVLLGDSGAVGSQSGRYESVGPTTRDARIHFALVCASVGCPPLAREAYQGSTVDAQLDRRAKAFVRDKTRCRFDKTHKHLALSELFDWYAKDFSNRALRPHAESVLGFLAMHVSDAELRESLRTHRWRISYLPYEWRLNLQPGR